MNWKDKNVLITGITGFVGSYLTEELIKREANVYGLTRGREDFNLARYKADQGLKEEVKYFGGDLTIITSLVDALEASKPDFIFHLASQSFVPRSFLNPLETQQINGMGTANLLEAVRIQDTKTKIIFAGTSEEYGLVISSEEQYQKAKKEYGIIFPEPEKIPELPIKETNPLRPMSPYAVSKVYGEYLMRNYYHSYGLDNVVSRAFNHEGAGRGTMFVTSVITNQIMKLKSGEINRIIIGNINPFRDWTYVEDIIQGYILLADKGLKGEVYNQGSMRTNSVLSYMLLGLEEAGWNINKIETINNEKKIENPTEINKKSQFGIKFTQTMVDQMMLMGELEYTLKDKGINVHTDTGKVLIEFNPDRFRPAEVPISLANTKKIQKLGAKIKYELKDIIKHQINYFKNKDNRI
jgi:GDPmannose 4,6-dehydratase